MMRISGRLKGWPGNQSHVKGWRRRGLVLDVILCDTGVAGELQAKLGQSVRGSGSPVGSATAQEARCESRVW